MATIWLSLNVLIITYLIFPPAQSGNHFADDIFVTEKFRISLKFVRKGPIYNNPALV